MGLTGSYQNRLTHLDTNNESGHFELIEDQISQTRY